LNIVAIILILLAVIIIYFATKFLGKAFKIITKILLLLVMVLVVLTLLVSKDMNDLRKGFTEKNNTFFLYDNNRLYSAVTLKPMSDPNLNIDSFIYFESEDMARTEQSLNEKRYEEILGNNFRVLIIKPELLNKPYTLKLGVKLDQRDLLDIVTSEKPAFVLAEKTQREYNISVEELERGFRNMYGSEEKLKGYLFAAMLSNRFQAQKPGELVEDVKERKLIIYPETISFKVIRYMPWVLT